MDNFYVYVYLDPRKTGNFNYQSFSFLNEPFYVGKGVGDRLNHHIKKQRKNDKNIIKNSKIKHILEEGYEPIIIKIYEDLSEEKAFLLEKKAIEEIGIINLKTGPLTNMTIGGTGGNTWECRTKESKNKTKEKLSIVLQGHKTYWEMIDNKKSEEIKKRIKNKVNSYYADELTLKEHSEKTKRGMLEKGFTPEEISKRTKEGMKKVPKEKLAFWKYHQRLLNKKTEEIIIINRDEKYDNNIWIKIAPNANKEKIKQILLES